MKGKLRRLTVLPPRAGHRVAYRIDRAVVSAAHRRQFEMNLRIAFRRLRRVKSVNALVDAVHCRDEVPLRVVRNVELQSITHPIGFDRALPCSFCSRHRSSGTLRKHDAWLPMKNDRQTRAAL